MGRPSPRHSTARLNEGLIIPDTAAVAAETSSPEGRSSGAAPSLSGDEEGAVSPSDPPALAAGRSPNSFSSPERANSVPLEMVLDAETSLSSAVGAAADDECSDVEDLSSQTQKSRGQLGGLATARPTKASAHFLRPDESAPSSSQRGTPRALAAQPTHGKGLAAPLREEAFQSALEESLGNFDCEKSRRALPGGPPEGSAGGLGFGEPFLRGASSATSKKIQTAPSASFPPSGLSSSQDLCTRSRPQQGAQAPVQPQSFLDSLGSSRSFETEVAAWPGRLKARDAVVEHVVFVVHGIGCGSRNEVEQQDQLRNAIRCPAASVSHLVSLLSSCQCCLPDLSLSVCGSVYVRTHSRGRAVQRLLLLTFSTCVPRAFSVQVCECTLVLERTRSRARVGHKLEAVHRRGAGRVSRLQGSLALPIDSQSRKLTGASLLRIRACSDSFRALAFPVFTKCGGCSL